MFNCEVGRLSDRLYRDLAVPFKIRLEITFLQIRVISFTKKNESIAIIAESDSLRFEICSNFGGRIGNLLRFEICSS